MNHTQETMRTITLVLALVVGLGLPAGPALCQSDPELERARAAAEAWLSEVDRGAYGACWDAADSALQQSMDRPQWTALMAEARTRLGPIVTRTPGRSKLERDPDDAPPGLYGLFEYTARHENGQVDELVVVVLEDGEWRVVGYMVR
jgi:hypothetical protein